MPWQAPEFASMDQLSNAQRGEKEATKLAMHSTC